MLFVWLYDEKEIHKFSLLRFPHGICSAMQAIMGQTLLFFLCLMQTKMCFSEAQDFLQERLSGLWTIKGANVNIFISTTFIFPSIIFFFFFFTVSCRKKILIRCYSGKESLENMLLRHERLPPIKIIFNQV